MTRILAGRSKGRRLRTPTGLATRPTGARVRQTLFDILAPRIPGCRFLDAFAGSGGIGLEALSRGAARVVLMDNDPAAVAALRENAPLVAASSGGEAVVQRQDARVGLGALAASGARFDVVYLDPPYASPLCEEALDAIARGRLLADSGVVVVEHFKKRALPGRIGALARIREVRVGDHTLSFYVRQDASQEDA
jgi:16S rRNA (guanine(966)-N(2))-methyltransferase RsmD